MDGIWQGVRCKDGDRSIAPIHINGHIAGGAFDGAKAVGTDQIVSPAPNPVARVGTVESRLLTS